MDLSVAELRRVANMNPASRLAFQLLLWQVDKPPYAQWVELVEESMSYAIAEAASRRNDLHDLDEDAITAYFLLALKTLNLNATAEVVNGNTDVSISFSDYRWLGEAKIAKDLSKIYHGYQQLVSRYATGLPNQSSGGILLYCTHASAVSILAGWKAALLKQHASCGVSDGGHPLVFTSTDTCPATGLELSIRHYAIPLFHQPMEDVLKLSTDAIDAGRAARREVKNSEPQIE